MTIDKTTLRNVTTAARRDASAEGKAGEAFFNACQSIALAFQEAGITERKGKAFAEVRAAAVNGWTSGRYPMQESGAAQRWNRASRNAMRINGDAPAWESKTFPSAKFESAGGRGLDKDWQPCKPAAAKAKGISAPKAGGKSGPVTASPEPAAGNVSGDRIAPSELHSGAVADLTELLALASDHANGKRIAALATSAIRKLEMATGTQLTK